MTTLQFDTPPSSICILRLSAIGDVTHVLPIIATLRNKWPETKITWIIGATEFELVKNLEDIEFIVFNKKNGVSEYISLRKKLYGRYFEILLMMQVAFRANLLSTFIKAKYKIGYDNSRSKDLHSFFCNQKIEGPDRVHVLDTFFQFLEKTGINQRTMDWLIKPSTEDISYAVNFTKQKPTIIINPCSSIRKNNWRNWPAQYYAKIIDNLITERKYQVILSGGPSINEVEFSHIIEDLCEAKPTNLVGKTSLLQLLALMQQSKLLISPDTGPAHMGTIAGIPVLGLYASSNPLRTGPYNSQDSLINAYPEALMKYLNKTPDQVKWGSRVRHPDVMKLITVEMVLKKLTLLIDQ